MKIFIFTVLSTVSLSSEAAQTIEGNPDWVVYGVAGLVVAILLVSFMLFNAKIAREEDWSISSALSEEIEVTNMRDGNVITGADQPKMITKLSASSSRLIAFLGTVVILCLFIGFGLLALIEFAKTGKMPAGMVDAIKFLVGGLTLFAPYAVNKFSSIFSTLSNPK